MLFSSKPTSTVRLAQARLMHRGALLLVLGAASSCSAESQDESLASIFGVDEDEASNQSIAAEENAWDFAPDEGALAFDDDDPDDYLLSLPKRTRTNQNILGKKGDVIVCRKGCEDLHLSNPLLSSNMVEGVMQGNLELRLKQGWVNADCDVTIDSSRGARRTVRIRPISGGHGIVPNYGLETADVVSFSCKVGFVAANPHPSWNEDIKKIATTMFNDMYSR